MGCGCGRSATPPTGSQAPAQAASSTPARVASAASAAPAGSSTPVPVPGSNTSGATESYALTTRDGKTQRFGSKLEADAERVRRGGGSVRRVG